MTILENLQNSREFPPGILGTVDTREFPVTLEYCVPVWHYALTKAQTEHIEAVQKRVIHIVLNFSRGMPYMSMLSAANLSTLVSRREEISRKFFLHISQPTSCLHHLLPDPRDHSVISRLRTYEKYPRVFTRTKRYCSYLYTIRDKSLPEQYIKLLEHGRTCGFT